MAFRTVTDYCCIVQYTTPANNADPTAIAVDAAEVLVVGAGGVGLVGVGPAGVGPAGVGPVGVGPVGVGPAGTIEGSVEGLSEGLSLVS